MCMTAHDIMGTVAPQEQNDTLLENVDMKLDVLHNCYKCTDEHRGARFNPHPV